MVSRGTGETHYLVNVKGTRRYVLQQYHAEISGPAEPKTPLHPGARELSVEQRIRIYLESRGIGFYI